MDATINASSIEAVCISGYRSPSRGESEPIHSDVMNTRFPGRLTVAALVLSLAAWPHDTAAQSVSQLGAWDGLMLSPIGALAPVASDLREIAHGPGVLSLRYGRWRYDAEDAVHDNIGLAWSHSLGFARTQVTLTGAYGLVECPACSSLAIAGIDLQSTLLTRIVATSNGRPASTGVGLRVSFGGGSELATNATTAVSAAIALPIDIALPFKKASLLCASIIPGFGFGRTASTDLTESGFLPMLGGALAWTVTPSIGVSLGVQRIFIAGGPTQLGGSISLKLGSGSRP